MIKFQNFYKENFNKLTKTEKKILEYIIKNPKYVIMNSALEIGKELSVSDASVLRLSKTLGFNKFSELKSYITSNLNSTSPNERIIKNWNNFHSENDIANKTINADIENIKNFLNNLDFNLLNKTTLLLQNSRKIYFLGLGSSKGISQFMFWYMRRLGFETECINEGGLGLYETLSHLKKGDTIFIFSFPRILEDEIKILKLAKEKNIKIISITSNDLSEIILLSDISFQVEVENFGFFNSYAVPIQLCNLILTMLFEKNKNTIYKEIKDNSFVQDFLFHKN
ncbi:MurR/RpiR family transcriptional regulator [uncultured Fusobacterium sp.]|uniref:MurR/RpiR family transcriptional regulator n=1 Tax=uncultured Fusobacterium sp. TaxID=159267 RepID=UPI0025D663BD|nr:MurR/RpiR family transcriptional regulator [uncultured Fusobacterium sp.]